MHIYTIYKATNKVNNKSYIGFDSAWPNRMKQHLSGHSKVCKKFHRAIKKYGQDSFIWEILYQSKDQDHCLNVAEPYFIQIFNSQKNGYNIQKGGQSGMLGFKHSEKSKQKTSKALKGRIFSENTLEKMRKPKSEQHRLKIAKANVGKNIGRLQTDETKLKISKALEGNLYNAKWYHVSNKKLDISENIQSLRKFAAKHNLKSSKLRAAIVYNRTTKDGWKITKL